MPTLFINMRKTDNNLISPNFKNFLELLGKYEVPYLVIGGYAVAVHGYVRATGDLDVWIHQTPENADKMLTIMLELGFSPYDFTLNDFLPDEEGKPAFIFIGEEPIKIDILGAVGDMSFEVCYNNKVVVNLEGIHINFMGKQDLIQSKQNANRPKDLIDLEKLNPKS